MARPPSRSAGDWVRFVVAVLVPALAPASDGARFSGW
jgi:hypothetical protein